jgi:hypothetical protein
MVVYADPIPLVRVSIKAVAGDRDPQAIHAQIQGLCVTLASLSGLGQMAFSFFRHSPGSDPGPRAPRNGGESIWHTGLQFEAPTARMRVVLRCLSNWLDRFAQRTLFVVEIPPVHTLSLQTDQASVLVQLLPLVETLLPPYEIYRAEVQRYVGTYGEVTPAVQANLDLLQQRLGLAPEETNDLKRQILGPFKTLSDKYQHFRQELLVCRQESDLTVEFWQVMRQKAITMGLPEADADFLKAERLATLRAEAEAERQRAEAEAEAERQRQRDRQRCLADYRNTFEELAINALRPLETFPDEPAFHQGGLTQLTTADIDRGRLDEAREFYRLSPQEAGIQEKIVLDELYLLSGLL